MAELTVKPDYTKQCWSCGGTLMVDRGKFWECRSCGATWTSLPQPGYEAAVEETVIFEGISGNRVKYKGHRPHGLVVRRASKGKQ